MKLTRTGKSIVKEVPYGLYVWCMPDGKWVGDDDGHFLSIPSEEGNRKRIAALKEAVRSYGVYGGWAFFLSGNRQVTDAEYEEQRQRLAFGLVPDVLDAPVVNEERRIRRING